MTTLILAVGLSIFISALCSLLESVLYSTRVITLEAAAAEGSKRALTMKALKAQIDRPLSAILILNTVANTAGAALAGWAAGQVWGAGSLWVFSLVFTLAILTFSEILPKTMGAVHWRGLWRWSVPLLRIMTAGLAPLAAMARWLTRLITGTGRIHPPVSEDEILAAVRLGAHDGQISEMEHGLIKNIIMLEEQTASDIMTPRTVMFSVDGEQPLGPLSVECREWPHSRVPVYVGGPEEIKGYLIKDELLAADGDPKRPAKDLAKPIHFMPGSIDLLNLLNWFLRSRQHICLVVDEYGGIMGLVTLEDVVETMVGSEIVDETDMVVDMQDLARKRGAKVLAPGPTDRE